MATNKKKSTKKAPSGTVVSVRFSNDELAYIKQAAKLEKMPSASFVRKSALRMAIEQINGLSDPKQEEALAKLAAKIAGRIIGKGDRLIELTTFTGPPDDQYSAEESEYVTQITPGDDYHFDCISIRRLEEKDLKELLLAIQLASHPFADALEVALKSLSNQEQKEEDEGFKPTITDVLK